MFCFMNFIKEINVGFLSLSIKFIQNNSICQDRRLWERKRDCGKRYCWELFPAANISPEQLFMQYKRSLQKTRSKPGEVSQKVGIIVF